MLNFTLNFFIKEDFKCIFKLSVASTKGPPTLCKAFRNLLHQSSIFFTLSKNEKPERNPLMMAEKEGFLQHDVV